MKVHLAFFAVFTALGSSSLMASQADVNAKKVGAPYIPETQRCEARISERSVPSYPSKALRTRAQGWVVIDVRLASDGSVKEVKIADSNGSPLFKEVAQKSAASSKYVPGTEAMCKSLFTFSI